MTERAAHGGDVRGIARAQGRAVSDFIDFSANINPLGPPQSVRELLHAYARGDWLTRYPEPGLPELTTMLAHARGVGRENVVVHGGSAALFDVILRAVAPRRLGMCLPAFAEYARAAAANGISSSCLALDARSNPAFDPDAFIAWAQREALDAVVLTNPHNPLGFALPATTMLGLRAALPNTTFVIDEAFADYDERVSVATNAVHDDGFIVVRSVTKFYAIPDLRVGYAVMSASRARSVARYLPAWPVSGIAAAAAAVALRDENYAAQTRARNAENRATVQAGLTALGLRVLAPTANFMTFEASYATKLAERLLTEHGIIVRDCSTFAGLEPDRYLRVAVRAAEQNALLLAAIGRFV